MDVTNQNNEKRILYNEGGATSSQFLEPCRLFFLSRPIVQLTPRIEHVGPSLSVVGVPRSRDARTPAPSRCLRL
jgi:hypothetical protein